MGQLQATKDSNGKVAMVPKKGLSEALVLFFPLLLALSIFAPFGTAQNPVGYWKFDDGSGTTALDSSGHGHTARLVNGVSWVPGKMGDAVYAHAQQNQYVSIPPIDLSGTKAATVTLWANRTYTTGGGHVLFEATTNYNDSTTGFGFFPDDATCQGIQAALQGNVGYVANCYNQPSSGVWHHIAVVFDKTQTGGEQVKYYLDGVLQPVAWNIFAYTNTNYFGSNPVFLFSRGGTREFNPGKIDDLRIYSTALTAAQIQAIYHGPKLMSIAVTPVDPSIAVGGHQQFTATGTYSDGSHQDLTTTTTWTSTHSSVASITGTGVATGVSAGTTTIQAAFAGIYGSTELTVTPLLSHWVGLVWTASVSHVVGYNTYRSTTSGGPYTKVNSSLISTTSYNDRTVHSGTKYYYVTTAVDSNGLESVYSNQAVAVIP